MSKSHMNGHGCARVNVPASSQPLPASALQVVHHPPGESHHEPKEVSLVSHTKTLTSGGDFELELSGAKHSHMMAFLTCKSKQHPKKYI